LAKRLSRPTLTWTEIVEYTFLGEFDLLRDSRADVRTASWADPAHREATVKYLQIRQAHVEIERLNVEICRLRTAIHDESIYMNNMIMALTVQDPGLAAEIGRRWKIRSMVNALHIHHLDRIAELDGFSGKNGVGVRVGSESNCTTSYTIPSLVDDEYSAAEEGEEVIQGINDFTNFELSITE
jgi:hypothetical protein